MKQREVLKDNTKGQKILAAVYLVSAHLSDNDPLKQAVRGVAVDLVTVDVSVSSAELQMVLVQLQDLLGAAVLAGLISEKNSSIIVLEAGYYVRDIVTQHSDKEQLSQSLEAMFGQVSPVSVKASFPQHHEIKVAAKPAATAIAVSDKTDRQSAILSLINDRKSATIKDIVTLFPDVSEKTVQRELIALVANGSITKRGEKRWSVYMSVA